MNVRTNPRALCYNSLIQCEKNSRYANLEVNASLLSSELSEKDKRFYTTLFYGVVERKITLDYIIDMLSGGKADREARCALRIGLYQLMYMDKVPCHAAVSESVELCPKKSRGFVNAVLRTYIREYKEKNLSVSFSGDLAERMSVEYSAPSGLVRHFISAYGEDPAQKILMSAFSTDRVCLRINTLRHTLSDAEQLLSMYKVKFERSLQVENVLVLSSFPPEVRNCVERGDFFVQDISSACAVEVLSPVPGSTLIDVCSAPGGKSFGCGMFMDNRGKIYSYDLHENKLSLVKKGADRLGIDIIETSRRDGRLPDEELIGAADYVLCDVPCSGLGVISKKPDIKYKYFTGVSQSNDIKRLPEIQYKILEASSLYLKPGGELLYSTCTLNPAENEMVSGRFLENHSDFSPMRFSACGFESVNGGITLFPHLTGGDGFYICKMKRNI